MEVEQLSLQFLGSANSCVGLQEIAKEYQFSLIVPSEVLFVFQEQANPLKKKKWLKMVRCNKTILSLSQGLLRSQLGMRTTKIPTESPASQNSATSVSFTGIRFVSRLFCLRNHYLHQSISFYQGVRGDGPESCLNKRRTYLKSKLQCGRVI